MTVEIQYSKAAMKFLRKNANLLTLQETEQLVIMAVKSLFRHERLEY